MAAISSGRQSDPGSVSCSSARARIVACSWPDPRGRAPGGSLRGRGDPRRAAPGWRSSSRHSTTEPAASLQFYYGAVGLRYGAPSADVEIAVGGHLELERVAFVAGERMVSERKSPLPRPNAPDTPLNETSGRGGSGPLVSLEDDAPSQTSSLGVHGFER